MLISGVQKITLLDFPEKTACVVFTPGCNFRCGYCHNPEFVLPEEIKKIRQSFIAEAAFFNFLKSRKNFLEGVVITGGEPTLMPDLLEFVKKIKAMGFLVKIDSNGSRPEILKTMIEEGLLDYIAMDIKTTLRKYPELVGDMVPPENIKKSLQLIMNSQVPYEFRSTILPCLHPPEILKGMARLIKGADKYYLQTFRPGRTLDPKLAKAASYTKTQMEKIAKEIFAPVVKQVEVRV